MNFWPSVPLNETAVERGLVGGPFGSSLVGRDYVESGVPVIRGTNLNYGRELGGDYAFVSEIKASKDLARNIAEPGDLIFTQRGTLGQVALVPFSGYAKYVVSQSQMRLRVDPAATSPVYLYYACSSGDFLKQVSDNAIATGVPHINLGVLSRLEVHLPSLNEQQGIANVLGALDDKIAINARVAQASEALLAAEFVALGLEKEPGDGGSAALGDLVGLNPAVPRPSEATPVYVDMQKLPISGISIADWTRRSARGGARFQNGDTLLARITPCLENRKTGYVDFLDEGQVALGSTEYIVMRSQPGVPAELSYFIATSERFRLFAIRHMSGTSGRQRVSAASLAEFKVTAPEVGSLEAFGRKSSKLFALVKSQRDENRTLSQLRDALLPQLMSGKLRVKNAEKAMEEVL